VRAWLLQEWEGAKKKQKEGTYAKKSMKLYDVFFYVNALMDDYTRQSSRHKYSNKEGSQEEREKSK